MIMYAQTQLNWDGTNAKPLPSMPRLVTRDINEVHHHMSPDVLPA